MLLFICSIQLQAAIRMPSFFSDGMVLQRNIQLPVWGWAAPGEQINLVFNKKNYTTQTGLDGKWKLFLNKESEGGPFIMTIQGSNSILIQDVLVGDVWFCSGQSNMEYELYKSAEIYPTEIASSNNNQIRHFKATRNIDFNSNTAVETKDGWEVATPFTVMNFTAVGYFFARTIFEQQQVPIGLINCTYGGTPVEAWMHEDWLKNYNSVYAQAIQFKEKNLVKSITEKDKLFTAAWNKLLEDNDKGLQEHWKDTSIDTKHWQTIRIPSFWQDEILPEVAAGVVWFKKEIMVPASWTNKQVVLRLGNIAAKDVTYINGVQVGTASNRYVPRKYELPLNLLKPGKNVITVRVQSETGNAGFIADKMYQLETTDEKISLEGDWKYKLGYASKPLLRNDVTRFQDVGSSMYHGMLEPFIGYGIKGVLWYQGESNVSRADQYLYLFSTLIQQWRKDWQQGDFPFLYVQLANNNAAKKMPYESKLALLQEAQQQTLQVPNTGMCVINDIGEWNDVHPVNKKDVGKRLALVASNKVYGNKKVVYSGPELLSYQIKKGKIILQFKHAGTGLVAKEGGALQHFAIADSSKKFVWAMASIKKNKVTVWQKGITNPVAVRYAWADTPAGANLYNKEGLPASCFRTDKW